MDRLEKSHCRRLQAPRRRHHGDALHPGGGGRHGVHQHGGGIGGPSARNIDAHRLKRRPTPAQLDAGLVLEPLVGGPLTLVIGADALGGEGDGLANLRRALLSAFFDLRRRDPDILGADICPVELTATQAPLGLANASAYV